MKLPVLLFLFTTLSLAAYAEPIDGSWQTQSGQTVTAAPCKQGTCLTAQSGVYAGKPIGTMQGHGAAYTGTLTDPTDNKTYTGSAKIEGTSLHLKGCVLKYLCKSQTWSRLPAQ